MAVYGKWIRVKKNRRNIPRSLDMLRLFFFTLARTRPYQLYLAAQIQIPLGVHLLEEVVGKVVDEVDAFAG